MATPAEIRALANMLEEIFGAIYGGAVALPDHESEPVRDQLSKVLETVQHRLMMYLAYTDDMLVGAEYCDECGDVVGTVVRIDREPELMIITNRGGFYPSDSGVSYGCYFRLPGSDAYGDSAIAELARARAERVEKQQQFAS
jgi:hypothetical protein